MIDEIVNITPKEIAKAIDDLLEENERLKDLCIKYEEEHKTTFETWLKEINILTELEEWLKEIKKIYEEDVFDIVSNTIYNQCEDTLDKIQELKERYK